MGRRFSAFLVSWALLLSACAGGGGGSSSPGRDSGKPSNPNQGTGGGVGTPLAGFIDPTAVVKDIKDQNDARILSSVLEYNKNPPAYAPGKINADGDFTLRVAGDALEKQQTDPGYIAGRYTNISTMLDAFAIYNAKVSEYDVAAAAYRTAKDKSDACAENCSALNADTAAKLTAMNDLRLVVAGMMPFMLLAIQAVDPSATDIPLNAANYVKEFTEEMKIIDAVRNVAWLSPVNITPDVLVRSDTSIVNEHRQDANDADIAAWVASYNASHPSEPILGATDSNGIARDAFAQNAENASYISTRNGAIDTMLSMRTLYNTAKTDRNNAQATLVVKQLGYDIAISELDILITFYESAKATYDSKLSTYNSNVATYNSRVSTYNDYVSDYESKQQDYTSKQATYSTAQSTYVSTYVAAYNTAVADYQNYVNSNCTSWGFCDPTSYASAVAAAKTAMEDYESSDVDPAYAAMNSAKNTMNYAKSAMDNYKTSSVDPAYDAIYNASTGSKQAMDTAKTAMDTAESDVDGKQAEIYEAGGRREQLTDAQADLAAKQSALNTALDNFSNAANAVDPAAGDAGPEGSLTQWEQEGRVLAAISGRGIDLTKIKKHIEYVWDPVYGTYTITFRDDERAGGEIRFKASDFLMAKEGFYEVSAEHLDTDTLAYTFLPGLKSWLWAAGETDLESRRNRANGREGVLTRIYDNINGGKLFTAEDQPVIDLFNQWFGTSAAISNGRIVLDDQQKKNLDLARAILQSASPDFDIRQIEAIVDVVKLGGAAANLKYSDFGYWTIADSVYYTGSPALLEAMKDTYKSSGSYDDYTFIAGIDTLRTGFAPYQRPYLNENQVQEYTGHVLAIATKHGAPGTDDVRLELWGDAVLGVKGSTGIGELALKFKDWYDFTYSGIDMRSADGFESQSAPDVELNGRTIDPNSDLGKIRFLDKDGVFAGSTHGNMYGPEAGNPSEAVGVFEVSTGAGNIRDYAPGDSANYTGIFVEGAYGAGR